METLIDFINGTSTDATLITVRELAITLAAILVCSFIIYRIVKFLIYRYIKQIDLKRGLQITGAFRKSKIMVSAMVLIVCGVILFFDPSLASDYPWFTKGVSVLFVIQLVRCVHQVGDLANQIYRGFSVAKAHPITSLVQMVNVFAVLVGFVWIVSILINQNLNNLMVSASALFAALSFVFKDIILNFFAGIQLTNSDMVQLGDRITYQDVDGIVEAININSVFIRNFDQTRTVIPPYTLIQNSFTNYRQLEYLSVRQFRRKLLINIDTVKLSTPVMLKVLEERSIKLSEDHQTRSNLYLYRAYINDILMKDPRIAREQGGGAYLLEFTAQGIPIQITAFTNVSNYTLYEEIVRDLFDTFLLSLDLFELKLYQTPIR